MKRFALVFCLGLLTALTASCGASRTEIVVIVDSNIAVPAQLDEIDIAVDGVVDGPATAAAHLTGAGSATLPVSLGVVRKEGALGPLTVTVTGRHAGAAVVTRRAVTSFVEGHTVVLRMDLLLACISRMCLTGQTCGEMGCVPEDIPPTSLPEWMGDAGSADPDAGSVDGGGVDMGPRDMGGVDLGPRDMGGVDLGPRDMGGVDLGPRDMGAPDAGGATCGALFGTATGFMLCSETATTCTMAVDTGGGDCNAFCAGFGATCMSAMGNIAADCTSSGVETCGTNRGTEICECTR